MEVIMKKIYYLFCLLAILTIPVKPQWVSVGSNEMAQASCVAINSNNVFVGTGNNGIFRSTDDGISWESVNNGLPMNIVLTLDNNSGRLFGSTFSDIVTSTDNGGSWSPYYNGLGPGYVSNNFLFEGDIVYAAGFGVYYSSDNGANWTNQNNGLPSNLTVRSITRKGSKLFAATFTGVYYSGDNGAHWETAGAELANYKLWSIITAGNNILAGTDTSGIFISTDEGATWNKVQTDFPNGQVRSFFKYGNYILAGLGFGWGIYLSTDDGLTWTFAGQGLPALYTFIVDIDTKGEYLFAAGGATGFFRRPLAELGITSVENFPNEIPFEYSLSQNFPNPFNPTTKMRYAIPLLRRDETGVSTTLKVYDVIGNEVATLVDEYKSAGNYEVEFDASNLASGIYLYKLQAGDFVEAKKMILLK
ncbi:MAG: T9SS type A sorting domain-containing protein [Ignavibacteriaceae bacterium]|nr:T9SS type A sorting domain-containing protein [Ignavibacteriaceae bacterium]